MRETFESDGFPTHVSISCVDRGCENTLRLATRYPFSPQTPMFVTRVLHFQRGQGGTFSTGQSDSLDHQKATKRRLSSSETTMASKRKRQTQVGQCRPNCAGECIWAHLSESVFCSPLVSQDIEDLHCRTAGVLWSQQITKGSFSYLSSSSHRPFWELSARGTLCFSALVLLPLLLLFKSHGSLSLFSLFSHLFESCT